MCVACSVKRKLFIFHSFFFGGSFFHGTFFDIRTVNVPSDKTVSLPKPNKLLHEYSIFFSVFVSYNNLWIKDLEGQKQNERRERDKGRDMVWIPLSLLTIPRKENSKYDKTFWLYQSCNLIIFIKQFCELRKMCMGMDAARPQIDLKVFLC